MSDISSTSSSSNMLRITGMATGLDVDDMVKKMMAAEQVKVDKAKQVQQIIKWKQEMYQDIIKDIKDLQSSFFDSADSAKNILSNTSFSGFDATVTDPTAAGVIAGASAKAGNYAISFGADGQLASGASKQGTIPMLSTSKTVTNLSNWNGKTITFSDGKSIDLDADNANVTDLVNDINDKYNTKYGVNNIVSAVSGAIKFSGVTVAKNGTTVINDLNAASTTKFSDLGGADTSVNLTYNGTTKAISIKATDTIADIINNISTTTSGSVKANFSELTGEFSIETSNSGSNTTINIDSISTLGLVTGQQSGKDAIVYITPPGGVATKVTRSSNNFEIDGINYNLLAKKDTTFSVAQNTQKVYDKIKDFIDKYNTIVDKIQTKLTEKKEYNYKPLTDAQKESMKDTEVTAWETKAKQGILKNDDNLQNLLNNLRSAFTTSVEGTGFSMSKYGSSSIGLDFASDAKKPAHVDIVDPTKLKEAIATKGDQILRFFTNISTDETLDTDGKTVGYHESGVFARIKDILEDNVGKTNISFNSAILTKYANKQDDYSVYGTSGDNTLPDQIYQKQLLINKLNYSLSVKQEAYYMKFSKLETAMNELNSQQSWLSQQLGG